MGVWCSRSFTHLFRVKLGDCTQEKQRVHVYAVHWHYVFAVNQMSAKWIAMLQVYSFIIVWEGMA